MRRRLYFSVIILLVTVFSSISLNAGTYRIRWKKGYKMTNKIVRRSNTKYRFIGKVKRVTSVVEGRVVVQPFRIVRHNNRIRVNIWTNRQEYYDGDRIRVYVRANRNCYIAVYDIDTEGNINIIYPEYGNGFIYGYRTRRIDRWWYVEGPEGYEELVVVASRNPIDAYNYGMYLRNQLEYGDNRGYFRVVPRRFGSVSVASTNFYINNDYGCDEGYYNDDYSTGTYDGFGFVIIEAPIWGWVYVDGHYYGRGDCRISKIKPGWHTITIRKNGGIKYKKRIYINKNKRYKLKLKH